MNRVDANVEALCIMIFISPKLCLDGLFTFVTPQMFIKSRLNLFIYERKHKIFGIWVPQGKNIFLKHFDC